MKKLQSIVRQPSALHKLAVIENCPVPLTERDRVWSIVRQVFMQNSTLQDLHKVQGETGFLDAT
jgi:hypothetical protein